MHVQGFLFDLDGTLINTNELILQSFEYALDAVLHTSRSREELILTFGKPLKQIMEEMAGEQAEELRQAFLDYSARHQSIIEVFPDAVETMRQLKARHIPTAIVTSKLLFGVQRDLGQFGMTEYFDVFITPESTTLHKPHPAPAQLALQKLGLQPHQAMMVGDSSYDILCGSAAGCKTAAVTYSIFGRKTLEACKPDVFIDSLTELLNYV